MTRRTTACLHALTEMGRLNVWIVTFTLGSVAAAPFAPTLLAMEPDPDVLALKPLAYWPADEGQGSILHDRSGNALDATLYHVSWKEGLLDFVPAFQWAEVPGVKGLLNERFSMGCWVYNRSDAYLGNGALVMSFLSPRSQWTTPNLFLKVRKASLIEVSVDNGKDMLGTCAAELALPLNQWQHLFFTYDGGLATLYLNGNRVAAKTGVPVSHSPANVLQFGGCGKQWQVYPSKVESFFGSLAGLVIFDRVLAPADVARLAEASRPARTPKAFSADAVVINGAYVNDGSIPENGFLAGPIVYDGEEVEPGSLASKPLSYRYRLLEEMAQFRGPRQVKPTTMWLPDLSVALVDWQTRPLAVKLLAAMHDERADAVLVAAMPGWINALGDASRSRDERAANALALSEMRSQAEAAVPILTTTLETLVAAEEARIPRVDDVLRNAAIDALFNIAPQDPQAIRALTVAFAKPIIDVLDLSKPLYASVKPLAEAGDYLGALDALKEVRPGRIAGEQYFSQGDRWRDAREWSTHPRAYSPKCEHNGIIYSLGEGISPNVAEPVSQEDFLKAVASLAKDYPQAAEWRKPDAPNLFRLKINKRFPDGRTESAFLVGEDFVFDGTDGKIRGWSIAVDTEGYIHIIGGQHNYPNTKNFISGAFLRMGFSEGTRRDSRYHYTDPRSYNPKYPAHMYWVSKRPYELDDFEFVGAYENPRKITSAECVNYMNFIQDNNGVLYAYFRTVSVGFHSLGLHRYDAKARRWSPVGAAPIDLMTDAVKENPEWRKLCIRAIRNGIPGKQEYKALTWAWQPNFYNYMRSAWGIRFDRTNRMHVLMEMRAVTDAARIIDHEVYAYSDDDGKTFHRADGSVVKLPLTTNPVSAYNADRKTSYVGAYWDLWQSNLKRAGY